MSEVTSDRVTDGGGAEWRILEREHTLHRAMRKRATGVPSYTVPEAAVLLSISQEHLYRLIRSDAFPAVRMRTSGEQGRYVVPAAAVERLLGGADAAGASVEAEAFTQAWTGTAGGDAA